MLCNCAEKKKPGCGGVYSYLLYTPNLVYTSVQTVPLMSELMFYIQPGSRGSWGSTSPKMLHCTHPKVNKPKPPLW